MASEGVLPLSTPVKKWLTVAGLTALLLWPFVHYEIVRQYRLDPRGFLGFATYCRPVLPVELDGALESGGGELPFEPWNWPEEGRRALEEFQAKRRTFGPLAPPNDLAAWIFRTHPDVDAIVLEVRHTDLEPRTAYLIEESFPYRYVRPEEVPR
jgi:hypothetical protein